MPVDGVVLAGRSVADEAMLTGEAALVVKAAGDQVRRPRSAPRRRLPAHRRTPAVHKGHAVRARLHRGLLQIQSETHGNVSARLRENWQEQAQLLGLSGCQQPASSVTARRSHVATRQQSCFSGSSVQVTAGTVNYEGALTVRATTTGADSTLAGIAGMVAAAQGQEAPVQRLADSVAGRFCFSVMAAAAATFTFWTLAGKRAWSLLTLQYCKPGLPSCLCRASAEVQQLPSLIHCTVTVHITLHLGAQPIGQVQLR